jgi:hypothetical protein
MSRGHRANIASLLVVAQGFTACTSWQVQTVTPRELIEQQHPKAVQIRVRGGPKYVLRTPRIEGDSIVGLVPRTYQVPEGLERTVAIQTVDRIAVRKVDGLKVLWWVIGFPFVALIGAFGLSDWGRGL